MLRDRLEYSKELRPGSKARVEFYLLKMRISLLLVRSKICKGEVYLIDLSLRLCSGDSNLSEKISPKVLGSFRKMTL